MSVRDKQTEVDFSPDEIAVLAPLHDAACGHVTRSLSLGDGILLTKDLAALEQPVRSMVWTDPRFSDMAVHLRRSETAWYFHRIKRPAEGVLANQAKLVDLLNKKFCPQIYRFALAVMIKEPVKWRLENALVLAGPPQKVELQGVLTFRAVKSWDSYPRSFLNDGLLEHAKSNFCALKDADCQRIGNAGQWLLLSRARLPYDLQLMCCVISIECLLSTDSQETTHKISERVAAILGNTSKERMRLFQLMRKVYNERSKIAHGSRGTEARVQERERLLIDADTIARRLLKAAISEKDFSQKLALKKSEDLAEFLNERVLRVPTMSDGS